MRIVLQPAFSVSEGILQMPAAQLFFNILRTFFISSKQWFSNAVPRAACGSLAPLVLLSAIFQ